MPHHDDEDDGLRSVALQNVQSILAARRRAEQELLLAKAELEAKSTELAHLLARTRVTLDAATDGLLVTDNAWRVLDSNAPYAALWNIPAGIMDTRDHRRILEFVSDRFSDPAAFLAGAAAIHASLPAESCDVLVLSDGTLIERRTRVQRFAEENVGRIWTFRDVTDQKNAEREHAYLASIVTSSSDAIVSKTLDGIITSWNNAAERIFGYPAAEAVGQPITLIIPPDRIAEEKELLARLRKGLRIEHYETRRVTKAGRTVHVSLSISPVKDVSGRIIGVSKIARDVTEREQLLAREQAARARAEEASRLKDEFLATVSHELRTPLNAILGWTQIMRSGKLDDDKVQRAIEVVERNARTQAQVIEDILDVSRIIAGKLRLDVQAIMPVTIIESALESARPMAEAKDVRLHAVLDPDAGPVTGDASRLQQVVWNLLSNAIKFTAKGGRVEVRLERNNSQLEIAVSDTGEGISPDFLPYVFDRFRQADASSTRTTTGLGLGLAIVRHLVELHGGLVTAASPGKGQGATFTVTLPLRSVQLDRAAEERVHPTAELQKLGPLGRAPRLDGTRVVIVDDEPDTRELLREVLEQCGAEVRDAGSARQALELIQQWHPDVIVSDIGMAGEDGYTFMRKVREWEKSEGTRIPAIALTAYARSEDRMRALLAGYQVHLSKPVEPLEFALVIAGVVHPGPRGVSDPSPGEPATGR